MCKENKYIRLLFRMMKEIKEYRDFYEMAKKSLIYQNETDEIMPNGDIAFCNIAKWATLNPHSLVINAFIWDSEKWALIEKKWRNIVYSL